MPERLMRKNDGFLRFQPYRAIVASPPVTQRKRFWSIFKMLLAFLPWSSWSLLASTC